MQQVSTQSATVARNAWLAMGLPMEVPAATVNSQCGSSEEANMMAHALVGSGLADIALSCGVEMTSSIPFGAMAAGGEYGMPREGTYAAMYEPTTQFDGCERIALKYGITREQADALGCESRRCAAVAWQEDRFAGQIRPLELPELVDTGDVRVGRSHAMSACATRPWRFLQDSLLLASPRGADSLGLTPRARIVDSVLVGCDPELMLKGPIPPTERLLERTGLALDDIDVFEINEAFASVGLAWQQAIGADMDQVNRNGGAIAVGRPLGGSGVLLTRAPRYRHHDRAHLRDHNNWLADVEHIGAEPMNGCVPNRRAPSP